MAELSSEERSALALAFCECIEGIGQDWLAPMEQALSAVPADAAIAAAVGMTFAGRGLWGKAAAPLERSARAAQLPGDVRRRAWRLLAEAARGAGDEARALGCQQQASVID